jgi:recombination protein RecA
MQQPPNSNSPAGGSSQILDKAARAKAIDLAIQTIEKQFGKGSIMRLGEGESLVKDVPAVSTGSLSLDIALGVGGLPRGRIVEIYGPEASGKTTLTLHAIAEAQKAGGVAAFVDAEHALDVDYARKLGVDTDNRLIRTTHPRASHDCSRRRCC